jgi:hypothetical protein
MFEESLALRRAIGARGGMAISCHNLAEVHLALHDTRQAAVYTRESLDLHRTLGDQAGLADAFTVAAATVAHTGTFTDAATMLGAADVLRTAVTPRSRALQEQLIHDVQAALGEAEFMRAWQKGSTFRGDAATAFVQEKLTLV